MLQHNETTVMLKHNLLALHALRRAVAPSGHDLEDLVVLVGVLALRWMPTDSPGFATVTGW